jgi:hypothetical protein
MWPVFNAHCGERNPFLALNMMAYGGFIVGLNSLGVMAADPSRSDFPSIKEGLRSKRPTLFREPGEDAVRLVRNGCTSPEFRQFIEHFDRIIASRSSKTPDRFDETAFSELMSEAFRRQLGLRDPVLVREEERLQRFASNANASCVRKYSDVDFCRCMIIGLQPMGLEESEWIAVGADFSALAKMASKYKDLKTHLRSCNK